MTNKINGINVSEEIRYCNNCSNLGLDFKTGAFFCSLSHRPDELPEVLSCDEFSTNCYIKHLQEENNNLTKQNQELFWKNWDLNYYVSCVKTNYEGARGALECILKNPNPDNSKYYAKIGLMYMDMRKDTIYKEMDNKYRKD